MSLSTAAGDVDLLLQLPGIDSFEGLRRRSVERQLSDVQFRVASVDDLIAMKKSANRPQDIAHLAELERIRKVTGPTSLDPSLVG